MRFWPKAGTDEPAPAGYPAYAEENDEDADPEGNFAPVMVHYTIDRPVGGQWGESDLAPALKWLSRYANWLEDRARLNRFRNSFLFVVKARFTSEAERQARQAQLAANPPKPGSILVSDESESWEVLSPKLESSDAGADGLALKKMIASGAGVPMHFLAEPEGSTRTTAEAAGGPTFRHFEQRQNYFIWLVADLLKDRRQPAGAGRWARQQKGAHRSARCRHRPRPATTWRSRWRPKTSATCSRICKTGKSLSPPKNTCAWPTASPVSW